MDVRSVINQINELSDNLITIITFLVFVLFFTCTRGNYFFLMHFPFEAKAVIWFDLYLVLLSKQLAYQSHLSRPSGKLIMEHIESIIANYSN